MSRKLTNLAIFVALGGIAFWTLLLAISFATKPTINVPPAAAVAPAAPAAPAAPVAPAAVMTPQNPPPQPQTASRSQLGINLSGLADWNTEIPFLDVFKLSRSWFSQKDGSAWGSGPPLALDPNGWVTRLEPGCYVESPLFSIEGGHYPAGTYTILYEGEGELELWGSAGATTREPGKITVDVQPAKGFLHLKLRSIKPGNYVKNIRVILPGGLDRLRENPWNPTFLKRWEGVACIRFMDWMNTNGSTIRSWNDRPRVEDASYAPKGAPVEVMLDLCNRLQADPWFCMPHLADDDYVRHFAQLVREKLDKKRKIYVEYSNEVWNSGFEQNRYAIEQGKRQGLSPSNPWEGGFRFTGLRSTQIFKIWTDVFGGTAQLVRVLPSQAANASVTSHVMGVQDAYRSADVLAIAPYIGFMVGPETKGDRGEDLGAKTVASWTVDQVLDYVEKVSLPQAVANMRMQKKAASERGLRLVAYEAGQHLVGIQGAENDEKLTRLLTAANAHPRMKDLYTRYLDAWSKEGGDLLCHFNSVGSWSKWGSWGLLQYSDENPDLSPKFSATMRWARSLGQPVAVPK
ncbi:MAG TPA: hypothetical protein VNM14_21625 [Planctomycetota bacterium]|nr:hypothetical protein [Planctomycetota bacterium]